MNRVADGEHAEAFGVDNRHVVGEIAEAVVDEIGCEGGFAGAGGGGEEICFAAKLDHRGVKAHVAAYDVDIEVQKLRDGGERVGDRDGAAVAGFQYGHRLAAFVGRVCEISREVFSDNTRELVRIGLDDDVGEYPRAVNIPRENVHRGHCIIQFRRTFFEDREYYQ